LYRCVRYRFFLFIAIKPSIYTQYFIIELLAVQDNPHHHFFLLLSLCCEVVNISRPPPSSSIQIGDSMAQCKEQSMQGADEVFSCNVFYAMYICSCYRHFGTACWSLLQGLSIPRRNTSVSCVTTQESEDLIYIVVRARKLTG